MENNKPRILNFYVNWQAIKDACMQTIGKQAGENEPPKEWKRKLLICKHSPIRRSLISIKWEKIPSYVSTHFCRHVTATPYVSTSREDRTGVPREERKQTDNVSMQMDMNIQTLFNITEKRLCLCSDPTTIKYANGLVEAIREYDEDIAWACVPQCVNCGACVEPFGNCKYFENFAKGLSKEELTDIMTRYEKYNEYRDKQKTK